MEFVRDRPITGVRIEEVKDRDGMTIQVGSPACGGPLALKRNGAGSTSVSDNGGNSSSDIFRVIKARQLNENK